MSNETVRAFIHITPADRREGIPSCADAKGCERQDCPGQDKFDTGFGMAGGGYGVYVYCDTCDLVRGKDCEPVDDGSAA